MNLNVSLINLSPTLRAFMNKIGRRMTAYSASLYKNKKIDTKASVSASAPQRNRHYIDSDTESCFQ